MGGVPNGMIGSKNTGMQVGGMQGVQMQHDDRDPLWDTRSKFKKTLWITVGIFIVVASLVIIPIELRRAKEHAALVVVADPINKDNKVTSFVQTEHGTKLVIAANYTAATLPENTKVKAMIKFSKSGYAMLYDTYEFDGIGDDTVWRSNGQWFAILGDYHKEISEHDGRFMTYETPESCGRDCVPVIVVEK